MGSLYNGPGTGLITVGGSDSYNFNSGYADPFIEARDFLTGGGIWTGGLTGFVEDRIDQAMDIVDSTLIEAMQTIDALKNAHFDPPTYLAPILTPLDYDFDVGIEIPPIHGFDLGTIPDYNPGSQPTFDGDTSITVPPIPDFTPTYTDFYIPPPPPFEKPPDIGPVPEVPDPGFVQPPIFVDPELPTFHTIVIPDAPDIQIPDFFVEYPDFDFQDPPTGIQWTEPSYTPEIIDEVMDQIRIFLAGGTGIRPDIQELMFNKAGEREDQISVQAIEEVLNDYAGRGYTLPPGLMQKRVSAIRFDRNLKKQGISRDILIKTMEAEIENLRFAVTAGIQAEELFVRIFLAAVERAFLVARLAVEFALQLYGYQIEAFRAKQEEARTRAIVFEAQVRAALAQVEIYKAIISAELAKVEIDKAKVDLYTAQINAMRVYVEKYKAQIEAENLILEGAAIRVRAFGETVNVYVAQIQAEKVRFDAYDSQVKGELGKAQITEAEARAYVAEVQGISTGVSAKARAIEANVAAFVGEVQGYTAFSEAQRDKAQVLLAGIQARLGGFQADTARYVADMGRAEALGRLELVAWNSGNEQQLAYYRTQLALYDIELKIAAEQARIALAGLEAAGGLSTTIVGGALAAMHVGATISGSGSLAGSGNRSDSYSTAKAITQREQINNSVSQEIAFLVKSEADDYGDVAGEPPWGATGNLT
jgi:hypothetical protein